MATVAQPIVLTIAGSDSSGSSGLQADLPTFAALGAHGTAVVTVVTAQNSVGVGAFHAMGPELVSAQLDSLLADLSPAATKTGLLLKAAVVGAVTEAAPLLGHLVVDPVLVNSEGSLIVDPDVVDAYRLLCSLATVITPNRREAELLLGRTDPLDTAAKVEAVAIELAQLGAATVVVTGGRGADTEAADVVISRSGVRRINSPRIGSQAIRGTGCTFSAAVAAHLAFGVDPEKSLDASHAFVQAQLASASIRLGSGLPGIPHALPEWGT